MSNPCKYCRFRPDDDDGWLENESLGMLIAGDEKYKLMGYIVPVIFVLGFLVVCFL